MSLIKKEKKVLLKKKELIYLLKINDPFLMIDKVSDIIPSISGIGYKKITKKDWFYNCHFVNNPVMPGTLQTEAMLQTIVAIIYSDKFLNIKECFIIKSSTYFFEKIDQIGEIIINAKITSNNKGAIQSKASLIFNSKLVSKGVFSFIIPNKFKI